MLLIRRCARCAYRKSCTVIINGKQVCIRDGAWKQCEVRTHLILQCFSADVCRHNSGRACP